MARSAFTLFEVLLAMALFALAGLGAAGALHHLGETALEEREERRAMRAIQSALEERLGAAELREGFERIAADASGVALEIKTEPLEIENAEGQALTGMWRLRIAAKWGDDEGAKNSWEIETWRNENIRR